MYIIRMPQISSPFWMVAFLRKKLRESSEFVV